MISPILILIGHVTVTIAATVPANEGSGQSDGNQDDHVNLRGAGASLTNEVFKSWMAAFGAHRQDFTRVHMVYDPVGSVAGKLWMEHQGEYQHDIEYAAVTGKEAQLRDDEYLKYPDLQPFPTLAGAVVAGYHLRGVERLNLSMMHLVGIFNGTITYWDDPLIVSLNPGVTLPHAAIKPVVREDQTGTTEIFTEALSAFSTEWAATYGIFNEGADELKNPYHWNKSVIHYYGNTNYGMEGLILSVDHSIGYLSVADALESHIPFADIVNSRGYIVHPDVDHIHAAMDNAEFNDKFYASIVNIDDRDAYPICAYAYMIINMHSMDNCDSAVELYRYIEWFLFDEVAYENAEALDFSPLTTKIAVKVQNTVLSNFTCKGQFVADLVAEQKRQELLSLQTWRTPVFASLGVVIVIIISILAYIAYIQIKINRALFRNEWRIPFEDIVMYMNTEFAKSMSSVNSSYATKRQKNGSADITSITSSCRTRSKMTVDSGDAAIFKSLKVGKYGKDMVILHDSKLSSWTKLFVKTKRDLLWMRDSVRNDNVAMFYGLTETEGNFWFLTEFCSKGLLHDILQNDKYNLDVNFKYSMSCDVANGMKYLHDNGVVHGNLDSNSCYINQRWTVKISDWGYTRLAQLQKNNLLWARPLMVEDTPDEDILARNQLSVAPELLKGAQPLPTKECDIYSFAILMVEIFTREDPYQTELEQRTPMQVLNDVKIRGIRPAMSEPEFPMALQQLISTCWDWMPELRPTFSKIVQLLKRIKPSKKGVLDCMMEAVEVYAKQLEEKVADRTQELNQTMDELQTLLHKMLPPDIAIKLSKGEGVQPESYESVTVFFSDIVGFTALSSASQPIQIVDFLNDLYTAFDTVVDRHDVYKVETIGDAYMVISGLPRRNGVAHAGHIATMALELAIAVGSFKIRHRPGMQLQLRAGMHSGSVCAGVVGIKMPRYCLFGDTVNTASRMESTSVARKIQVSQDAHALLVEIGEYDLKLRGEVSMKGKGNMNTYWLHGKYGLQGVPAEFRRDVE